MYPCDAQCMAYLQQRLLRVVRISLHYTEDTVYMEDEKLREEYVLNDTGKVWCGSFRSPKGRRWIFGQFEDVSLPASVYLLEKANIQHSDRGNPIKVVRAISAIVSIPCGLYCIYWLLCFFCTTIKSFW